MSKITRRFNRQISDPNGGVVSLNERCGVSIVPGKAVIVKEGLRIIGFFDAWPEPEKLLYIRDEFARVLRDPRGEADPDWTLLAA